MTRMIAVLFEKSCETDADEGHASNAAEAISVVSPSVLSGTLTARGANGEPVLIQALSADSIVNAPVLGVVPPIAISSAVPLSMST